MARSRLVCIMGSGETAPTMKSVHRRLIDRLGSGTSEVAILDTPVGFQMNADEISAKALEYFRTGVQRPARVVSFRDAEAATPSDYERAMEQLRAADYVFAGPGSPTYALRHWRASLVPDILRRKLHDGGCITFASAAAVTLGKLAIPVYEIYKVGESVRWEKGLDLLSEIGLDAAVIPHFDNKEGGTHDTRFCYLGETRLQRLEEQLPETTFVLGIDEHTALILDPSQATAEVTGIGGVTVRRAGLDTRLESGETITLDELGTARTGRSRPIEAPREGRAGGSQTTPFWDRVEEHTGAFDAALEEGDRPAALDAALDLDSLLWEWSSETFGTDEMARARSIFRAMLVRVAESRADVRESEALVKPFVDALLRIRNRARAEERYDDADLVRDALAAVGIEVRDGRAGTTWQRIER